MVRSLIIGGSAIDLSATDAHATDDAGDGKRLHVAKRGVGHLSYRIALKPPTIFSSRHGGGKWRLIVLCPRASNATTVSRHVCR